ncbi:hypothetical protein KBTX_03086 [wastewater metagenome]|uniref:Uncharacterized protein n=2 Tax=unclassified sequences TaxID=12908 RepID=A0A5B8RIB9_9ZZZZ|nr:hypothetical protein KBTEX_03086 [uncultured organism]
MLPERGEAAEPRRLAALDAGHRRDVAVQRGVVVHGVAEEQAVQAETPAVALAGRGQRLLGAVSGVRAPADAALAHPGADALDGVGVQVEGAVHRRHLEDGEHLGGGETAARQLQQPGEHADHRVHAGQRAVGHGPGDVALAGGVAEHRLDVGGVAVDVRRHHHDVPGLEVRVREQPAQAVVEYLHLAHGAVAGVQGDGGVLRIQRHGGLVAVRAAPAQLQDIRLQACQVAEVCVLRRLGEVVGVVAAVVLEQFQELPAGAAEGGEQRVADAVVIARVREPAAAPEFAQLRQPALGDHVAPVVERGVEDEHVHGDVLGQGGEQGDVGRRRGGDAEDGEPWRQGGRVDVAVAEGGDVVVDQGGAVGGAPLVGGGDLAPQRGLPVRRFPGLPGGDPVRPVDQVLVVEARQAVGELVGLDPVVVVAVGEVGPQRGEGLGVEHPRQPGEHPPAQGLTVEAGLLGEVRPVPGEQAPDQSAEEGEGHVGGHAVTLGELDGQPVTHAAVGYDHRLLGHRRQRCRGHLPGEGVGEGLQAVAVVGDEHGGRRPVPRSAGSVCLIRAGRGERDACLPGLLAVLSSASRTERGVGARQRRCARPVIPSGAV